MTFIRSRVIMVLVLLAGPILAFVMLQPTAHGVPKASHKAGAAPALPVSSRVTTGPARAPGSGAKSVFGFGGANSQVAASGPPDTVAPVAPSTTTTTSSSTTTVAADPSTTTQASTSGSTGLTVGVSIPSLISQTPATQAAWLANLKSIGITSIRIGADWAWVQYAGPNTYDWTQLDQEVDSITAAGMTIDMVITGCPPWAATSGASDDSSPQPASASAYASFAADVAARYAPDGVTDFEIWNEPNIVNFWQPAPNPAAYTALLQASYASIKAVDPSAYVITGGLAPETNDGTNINAVTFLGDMFAAGAKGFFDAIGYHPYSYPALPDNFELWSGWSQMSQTPASIEGVLTAYGDAGTPLWLTEVGAPTNGPDGVGATAQAEELTEAIADAKATSWIGALYIYTYEDSGSDPNTDEDWFGLLNADGSPKPAFTAVAAALK